MPLRLAEIRVSRDRGDAVDAVLAEADVVDRWSVSEGDARRAYRVLLRSEAVEAVTDALSDRLHDDDAFRVVLLDVQATLPRVEEPAKEDASPQESAEADSAKKQPKRVSREELLQDLEVASRLTPIYLATVVLSTVVAAVGLLQDDVAVIIGAMVIAPLLGPNVALSLAATLGDLDLGRKAVVSNLVGAGLAFALSLALGFVVQVEPLGAELASRTEVGLSDVALALAAGSAGALAFTTGLPSAVIGVMVAVALLPPLVTTGLLVGAGSMTAALAAATLLATNITCVNLAGVATFLAQRVTPREWWEAKRARRTALLAMGTWISMLVALVLLILFAWN